MTQVFAVGLVTLGWPQESGGEAGYKLRTEHHQGVWVSKEEFEKHALPLGHIDHLPAHQQRMIAERAVNKDRLDKLNPFFDTEVYKGLGEEEQLDMAYQAQLMHELDVVLSRRIERFSQPVAPAASLR